MSKIISDTSFINHHYYYLLMAIYGTANSVDTWKYQFS